MGYRHYFFEVDKKDVEKVKDKTCDELVDLAIEYGMEVEAVKNAIPAEELAKDVAVGKAIDFIKENAVITEVEAKTEKKAKRTRRSKKATEEVAVEAPVAEATAESAE